MPGFKRSVHVAIALLLLAILFSAPATARHHASVHYRVTTLSRHAYHGAKQRYHRTGRHRLTGRQAHLRRGHNHARAVRRSPPQIGALIISESGETILDQLSNVAFNPASVAKMVTAYGAMKHFGLNHRFTTTVSMTGKLDAQTGILTGNLYVSGNDPDFERDDALALRQRLSESGIRQVNGKLIASSDFSLSSVSDAAWSVRGLSKIWSSTKEGIRTRKGIALGMVPPEATVLTEYSSETFRETLKEMLSFSQNGVAEQIGRCAGGIHNLEAEVAQEVGLAPGSLQLATASGLGRNRATPKDMMAVLKAFRKDLQSQGLDLSDVFPVAGVDEGTLDERFTEPRERGSVVGKTGTLPGTDGGASSLVGMFRTQQEDMYFVIFCWRGNVVNFRQMQDGMIRKVQAVRGGPKAFQATETVSSSLP